MRSTKSTGAPADPSAPALITLQRHLQLHLRPAIEQLRGVQSAIITSALALQHQNADADADVAHVLRRSASDPLDAEIERLETLFNALNRVPASEAPYPRPEKPAPLLRAVCNG